jgi:hypothetical protein
MAYENSDRPLPVVILRHPMQNLTEAELMLRARDLADAAERLLRGDDPQG